MTKKFVIYLVFSILLAASTSTAFAEIPEGSVVQDPAKAEADYRFQFDLYRSSYNNYLITKSEYLNTGSLRAEQEALAAAKITAAARTEVLKAYNRWILLRLVDLQSSFPQVAETITELAQQENWYVDHKNKIAAASSVNEFEAVMTEYRNEQKNRDKLYAFAQIDLKLAQIVSFQSRARLLYDPVLVKLEPQKDIAEVEQGLLRVTTLGEQINSLILETRTKAGAIKSEDLEITQGMKQGSERLETLRTTQLNLLNIMMELENRYAR